MNKPSAVKYAEYALWGSIVVTLILYVVERQLALITPLNFYGSLLVTGLCSIFPYKIGRGRSWARYTYLVLSALGYAVLFAGETEDIPTPEIILCWAHIPVDALIAVLLFREESNNWFKQLPERA